MKKITNHVKESYLELVERVTWPTWEQQQESTVVVLSSTLVITILVWLMDFGTSSILKLIYQLFK